MANCVLLSHGRAMPESPEAGAKFMQAWMDWYEQLGDKLVDRGNPPMIEKQIAPDGSVSDDSGSINGYLIISAETLDEAVAIARGCPVIQGGSTLQVVETHTQVPIPAGRFTVAACQYRRAVLGAEDGRGGTGHDH